MAVLYVVSTERLAGKTALCAGLAGLLGRAGNRVGYLKPVIVCPWAGGDPCDEDVSYLRQALGLSLPLEALSPVALRGALLEGPASGAAAAGLGRRIEEALAQMADRRDVVLAEGGGTLREGTLFDLAPARVARFLQAVVLLVVKYESEWQLLDDALTGRQHFGKALAGVILNAIPRAQLDWVEEVAKPALEERGIPVLGVLPLERLLQSVTIGEIAHFLSGEVVGCHGQSEDLVEHVMVGAMSAASALTLFRLKPNKAVITGWDRMDIQYAALETSTKCLILTGSTELPDGTRRRAEEVGVPLILVRQDTMAAVQCVEHAFGRTRCHHPKKGERFEELLAERADLARLATILGGA